MSDEDFQSRKPVSVCLNGFDNWISHGLLNSVWDVTIK